jgi:nucleoside-diphosphate-sugar epimerase
MLTHEFTIPTTPSRVVILGASGFLASRLAAALAEAAIPCRAVGSGEVDLSDIESIEKLKNILVPTDAVVMTAALTPDKGRDVKTLMTNLRMAENVSSALGQIKCAHLVYVSSDAVYDWRSSLISEQSSCEPTDLYAVMHTAREKILSAACISAKVPFAIVRPCAIYGAGDTHNGYGPNRFLRQALSDKTIKLFGAGEEQRDHVYIDDVVRLFKRILQHRSTGIVNAVSGQAMSFHDVASQIVAVMPDVKIECQPRGGPVTHRHFDTTSLAKAFPDFSPTPFKTGLASMIPSFRAAIQKA